MCRAGLVTLCPCLAAAISEPVGKLSNTGSNSGPSAAIPLPGRQVTPFLFPETGTKKTELSIAVLPRTSSEAAAGARALQSIRTAPSLRPPGSGPGPSVPVRPGTRPRRPCAGRGTSRRRVSRPCTAAGGRGKERALPGAGAARVRVFWSPLRALSEDRSQEGPLGSSGALLSSFLSGDRRRRLPPWR